MSATKQNREYRNPEWLRKQYIEKDRTQAEIAEICDCSRVTISRWLDRFGIEKTVPATFQTVTDGYEQWRCECGESADTVLAHRLLATLKVDDLSELDGKHVHHRDGVPWDNRLENIEVMDATEHLTHHANGEAHEVTV